MLLPRTLQCTNAIGPLLPSSALPPELPALKAAQSEFGFLESWSVHMIAPPMGDVKSPDIAQAVHTHVALECGAMKRTSWMRHGQCAPDDAVWSGTYVDDFGQAAILDRRLPAPFDEDSIVARAQCEHDSLLSGYNRVGIIRKSEKSVVKQKEGTMWGASLSSALKTVQSSVEKRHLLVRATLSVCASCRCAAEHMQVLLGHWMHQLLFKREIMSVLATTFSWLHVHRARPRTRVQVPRKVKDELLALCILAPLMHCDLTAPISRWVIATDATLMRGAATVAPLSPMVATTMYLRSDRCPQVMQFVRGECDEDMFVAKYTQTPDDLVHAVVACLSFSTVTSFRFREIQHVNKQEGLAWRSGIFAAIRRGLIQGSRCVCLLDSAVFTAIIKKGRSSSRRLNSVVRSAMPDLLCHGISALPVWIGTKHNPADDPTRGQRVRRAASASQELCQQVLGVVSKSAFVYHMAHLQWADSQPQGGCCRPRPRQRMCVGCSQIKCLEACAACSRDVCVMCSSPSLSGARECFYCIDAENVFEGGHRAAARMFDSTLGYPGEGPPQDLQKSAVTGNLASRVQRVTEARYEQRYLALCSWASVQAFPSFEVLVSTEAWQSIDAILTAYIQGLHTRCEPISHGSYTLAAFQYRWPEVTGKIPRSWLSQKQWSRLQPPNIRCPMPLKVMLALASAAWILSQPRMSVGFLISFLGLLRPGEWSMLRRQHIVLPSDLSGMEATMTIAIMQSKTSTRGPRIQSVLISDPLVVRLTQAVIGHDSPNTPLIKGGLRVVMPLYEQVRRHLSLQHSAFTLATMRGGGAIHHLQSCQSIAYLQWLGRWSSEKSVSHYLQLGLAASAMTSIPVAAREVVLRMAELAPVLLSTTMVPHPAVLSVTREKNGWAAA
eukprot:4043333-Amphidinium_carterae.1